MIDYFHRTGIQDGKYYIEEVRKLTFDLKPLVGDAVVTHYGGNGRIKFVFNGEEYTTAFDRWICCKSSQEDRGINKETDQYFDYSPIKFTNVDPEIGWLANYPGKKDNRYWIEVIKPSQSSKENYELEADYDTKGDNETS